MIDIKLLFLVSGHPHKVLIFNSSCSWQQRHSCYHSNLGLIKLTSTELYPVSADCLPLSLVIRVWHLPIITSATSTFCGYKHKLKIDWCVGSYGSFYPIDGKLAPEDVWLVKKWNTYRWKVNGCWSVSGEVNTFTIVSVCYVCNKTVADVK